LIAGLLYAGPGAVVTGASAAAWYGLEHADQRGPIRLLVPRNRSSRDVRWASIRRTMVPYDVFESGRLALVGHDRAVVEAAREAPGRERAEAIVIEALQRRLVRLADLAAMNDRLASAGRARAERAIATAAEGVWSVPESGLFSLVERSARLPEMWCNPDLFSASDRRLLTPDGWFDDVGLAVMVHSRRWHDGARWVPTVERDGDLVAHGVRVLPLAPSSIRDDPARVLARVEQAYGAARRAGGRPDVRAQRWRAW